MYILDYKLSKYLYEIRDQLLYQHIEYLSSFNEVNITSNKKDKILKAVSCFILNTHRNLCFHNYEIKLILDKSVYSRRLIYNGRDVNRKISYRYHRIFLDWLQKEGYITLNIGDVVSYKLINNKWGIDQTVCSSIILKEKLITLFEEDKQFVDKTKDVLVLRNKLGDKVTFNLNDDLRGIINNIDNYNALTRSTEICIGESIYLDVQGKKVFNNSSFDQGGRLYLIGENNVQSINSELRSQIKINGNSVVELDYSSLHPRMLAEISGHQLPRDFDPYDIKLKGYDQKLLRKLSKVALLIMINSEAPSIKLAIERSAMALNKEISDMEVKGDEGTPVESWYKEGLIPNPYVDVKEIIKKLMDQNNYISDYFFSGEGIRLQNLDSKIADYIINKFTQVGEVVIPIHDSFIVEEALKDKLYRTMSEGYEYVLGSVFNCVIEEK